MGTLISVWYIIKAVLGISFVIFWHELGHFLLAKWNGVYVKTFSIGFPPRLVRLFRHRETDYVLGSIPLGGYVHMLGEDEGQTEPAPGTPAVTDAEGQPRADVEPALANHPGAFFNKSVWARMAIISAGVVMNVLLGFACFLVVYLMGGKQEMPAIIGGIHAGGPAYEAGLRTGDEVLAIDDERNISYQDLQKVVVHSGPEQVLDFTVRRPGEAEPIVVPIRPRRMENRDMPQVGVASSKSLNLWAEDPFVPPPGIEGEVEGEFPPGGRVVAAGPADEESEVVDSAFELARLMDRYRDRSMTFRVEPTEPKGASRAATAGEDRAEEPRLRVQVTVPPVRFIDFGIRPEAGPVVGIRQGSPAEAAGLEPGDRVVAVDGDREYDPMRLPSIAASKVGESLTMTVLRDGEERELVVEPAEGESWSLVVAPDSPLNVDTIGMAMRVLPEVAAVREGSPAAEAGLEPGDTLAGIRYTWPKQDGEDEARTEALSFGDGGASWPFAFDSIQRFRADAIELQVAGREDALPMDPEPVDGWYFPGRGLRLEEDMAPIPPMSLAAAMERAGVETVEGITLFYTMLQRLFEGQVGPKGLSGPIRIAQAFYIYAGVDTVEFLWFLGFISINLAVVNFLPIPPLDGGRMVFLIGEAVRGRPLPESWQALPTYLGLIFLLGLMAFVLVQDTLLTFF